MNLKTPWSVYVFLIYFLKYLWEIAIWGIFFKDRHYEISGKHLLDSGSLMRNNIQSVLSQTFLLQIEKIHYQVASQWLLVTFIFKYRPGLDKLSSQERRIRSFTK